MAGDLDRLLVSRMGRRDFFRYAAIAGGAGVLAACRKATTGPAGGGGGVTRPPLEEEPGILQVFDWTGYGDDAYGDSVLWKAYATKFPDQTPVFTVFKDDDSSYAKVAQGARYDVAHPCGYRYQDWVDLDVLQPWDTALIPSYSQLNQSLQTAGQFDGQQYFIVADWGFAAPMYRADKVQPTEDSWGLIFDDRYAGKISWWDSNNMLVVAGLYHGVSNIWDMTDEELEQMKDFLIEKKDLVRFLWTGTDIDQGFADGDVWIAYAWPSSWTIAKSAGLDVVYMQPKEGRTSWFCGFALFKDTENYYHAHEYVDAWMSPKSALWILTNYGYGHTNTAVDLSKVSPELIEAFSLDDPAALLEPRTHVEVPIRRVDLYEELWIEVKAA